MPVAASGLLRWEPFLLLRLPASSSSGLPHRGLPPRFSQRPSLTPRFLSCPRAAPVLVMAGFLPLLCPGKFPAQYRSARNICSISFAN